MATRCFPEGRGDGGRDWTGEDGRVAAGVVTVEPPMSSSANSLEGDEADEDMIIGCLLCDVEGGYVGCGEQMQSDEGG